MYGNLYSYNEEVNGKRVWMIFKPNFREAITSFNGKNKILSDGKVTMEGELVLADRRSKFHDIFISEDAQWGLEDEDMRIWLYVTEKTKQINTPLGDDWNKEFNRILKKCKQDYWKKKKTEIRLYFYEAAKDKLTICYLGCGYGEDEKFNYNLNRYWEPYSAIDKRFHKPDKDAFILGRVVKTIGTKNSKLMDFIEPVHKIELDFEKDRWDFGGYEYKENLSKLEKALYGTLEFTVRKVYNLLEIARIQAYMKYKSKEPEFVGKQFAIKIWDAYTSGSADEVRKLYNVLTRPQNCTNAKFELRLEEEIECSSDRGFSIFFENGEHGYVFADWLYKNIDRCTDAKATYLGELRGKYSFYSV